MLCSKSLKLDFSSMWTKNFQMYKLGIEEAWETRGQIVTIHWIMQTAREFQENIYFCFTDYAKAFDCVDHQQTGKFFKRCEYQMSLPASWETYMQVKKQKLDQTWNRLAQNWERSMSRLYIVTLLI